MLYDVREVLGRSLDGFGDVDRGINEFLDYDEDELEEGELCEAAQEEVAWWLAPSDSCYAGKEIVGDAPASVFQVKKKSTSSRDAKLQTRHSMAEAQWNKRWAPMLKAGCIARPQLEYIEAWICGHSFVKWESCQPGAGKFSKHLSFEDSRIRLKPFGKSVMRWKELLARLEELRKKFIVRMYLFCIK
ncbi:hypothetical protein NDU88_002825 [Pleurodeles waltl]|uniref:Uncharacterized protein n=1 Tax=Pleurodeles waltl TaxID=8319 RepID=A0AAV7M9B5_PLEWA|nr:hypothetical protein NDU88_002825 [Pleurodeles waltl]